jgi:galactokinase
MTAARRVVRVRAPGRVNLIGDHTDYNDGLVLPVAIDRECVVEATAADASERIAGRIAPNGLRVRARSEELEGEVDIPADGSADPHGVEPAWGRFLAGVVRVVTAHGGHQPAADLAVHSSVPIGSGLSSSSALAVALTLALGELGGLDVDRTELARLALEAEVSATGVPGGLMDQLCSLFGEEGHALLIDCRSLAVEPVALPPGIAWLVVHSGVSRTLRTTEYAARRAECEAVARRLGVASLRDADPDQVADEPRARHVVSENERVLATVEALRAGDLPALGALMLSSHASLRDDYGVSTPELDLLVDLLVAGGAAGARLTGAGFGGCVVAAVQRNHADDLAAKAALRYRALTGYEPYAFVPRAVRGAGPVAP